MFANDSVSADPPNCGAGDAGSTTTVTATLVRRRGAAADRRCGRRAAATVFGISVAATTFQVLAVPFVAKAALYAASAGGFRVSRSVSH